jgi:hypothetical protein
LGALLFFALPTMLMLAFALPPTLVAAIVDRTPQKHAAFCVGSMNLTGTFPFLLELWTGPNTLADATATLTDVFSLLAIYGAAGFGWMLYGAIPPVVGAFLVAISQRRIGGLRAQQQKLIEEWGPEVAGASEASE